MSRPADTIARLADYLWYLLPAFMKRTNRAESLNAAWCETWGEVLDEVRETLESVPRQAHVDTADSPYLEKLGKEKQTLRRAGEELEDYRERVAGALVRKQRQGTIPGLIADLDDLGVTAVLWEPWVLSKSLLSPPTDPNERDAYIVGSPVPLTFDDGRTFDDGGHFDDYGEPTGAWAGHATHRTMWQDGAWVFITPQVGDTIKVQEENAPAGRAYRFDGEAWQIVDRPTQWAHLLVQVIAWDESNTQREISRWIRKTKPARARAVMRPEIPCRTLDDWSSGESPLTFDDGGTFDDWSTT